MWYWSSCKITCRYRIILNVFLILCSQLADMASGGSGIAHSSTSAQTVIAKNVDALQLDRIDLAPVDELLLRAATKLEEWDHFEALELATKAIELQPRSPHGYALQATIFARMGQVPEAIQDLTKAIEFDQKTGEHYRRRGAGHIKIGDYQAAISDLTMAIQLGENDLTVFRDRGYAFEQSGRYAKALREYSEILKISPSDYLGLLSRGWVYRCLGEPQNAIRDFDKILEENPLDKEARLQRVSAFIEAEQFEQAFQDIDFLFKKGYQDDQIYLDLAFLHFQNDEIEKALWKNEKALNSGEQDIQVLAMFQKGLFLLKQGSAEKGRQAYRKGIEQARTLGRFLSLKDSMMDLTSLSASEDGVEEIKREILKDLTQVQQDLSAEFAPASNVCKKSVS